MYDCSLHVYNANIEAITVRLSQCQFYSEKLVEPSLQIIRQTVQKNQSTLKQFLGIMPHLKNKKDTIVKFYVFDHVDVASIYSDFFELEGAFDMAKSFFEDIDAVVLAVRINVDIMMVEVKMLDSLVGSFSINLTTQFNIEYIKKHITDILGENRFKDEAAINAIYRSLYIDYRLRGLEENKKTEFLRQGSHISDYIL